MSREERAIGFAIGTSVLGAAMKLVAGIASGSMALVSSAADSIGDLLISVTNLFVVRYAKKAPDEDHNYGHAKIEGLGAMFEGGFITAAALAIVYAAVQRLRGEAPPPDASLGLWVMVPVLALTIATVLYLRRVASETGSLVVKADAAHYESDVAMNLGVLFSLVVTRFVEAPWIDPVVSILIALNMVRASAGIVREGFDVVLDRSLPPETVGELRAMLAAEPRIASFHQLRTRGGVLPFVDFHVDVRPEMTAAELHLLFEQLEERVRAIVGTEAHVLMHADPLRPETPSERGEAP